MPRAAVLVSFVAVLSVNPGSLNAEEIGFVETFALAPDREKALDTLIPGTEDAFYYRCLQALNQEQFDAIDDWLQAWIQRHGRTSRVREIENRRALLTFTRQPDRSLDYLRRTLDLDFSHQRESLPGTKRLPTRLDPKALTREALTRRGLAHANDLSAFESRALRWLIEEPLTPSRRRELLRRLTLPDHSKLPELILDDLNHKESGGFGSLPIHGRLFLSQLEECAKRQPSLLDRHEFVRTYLSKLRPDADTDIDSDAVRAPYLERAAKFVSGLSPRFNSLKAHILYHRLDLDRRLGQRDKRRFLEYLALPRNASYIDGEFLKRERRRQSVADLSFDFRPHSGLESIRNDEGLVRDYLQHFFVDDVTYEPYAKYVDDRYLKRLFAESKLLHGLGDRDRWSALLSPSELTALRDRVDIDFALTNRTRFDGDQAVRLDVFVKNVRNLIVKVFEIHTANFYRDNGKEIDLAIELDGLIPNWETTHEYTEAPLRRVRRSFEFPTLRERGVYVVDFIGNGKNSRALIRKGVLHHVMEVSPQGQTFRFYDENKSPRTGVTLSVGGHTYRASEDGSVTIPFSTAPSKQNAIVDDGELQSLLSFDHLGETYKLEAGIYVDRESLIADQKAKGLLRAGLYLCGERIPISVLKNPTLVLTARNHQGIVSTKRIEGLSLDAHQETEFEFLVPASLAKLDLRLEGSVDPLTTETPVRLSKSKSISLNGIETTDKIDAIHFSRTREGHVVEVLGRAGEPRALLPLNLEIKHRDFTQSASALLQTDAKGRAYLGVLKDVAWVRVSTPSTETRSLYLHEDEATRPDAIHLLEGEPFALAFDGTLQREDVALIEVRHGSIHENHFSKLSLREGFLGASLAPGDYQLHLKLEGTRIPIRVTQGTRDRQRLLGQRRILEDRGFPSLRVRTVDVKGDLLRVQVLGATKQTRVHLLASDFYPKHSSFDTLSRVGDVAPSLDNVFRQDSRYHTGRDIGDEYRYILDRKYARKYPGNMLERPSLLLNPWATHDTETQDYSMEGSSSIGVGGGAGGGFGRKGGRSGRRGHTADAFESLDFLSQPTTTHFNLRLDERGVLTMPRESLGSGTFLQVIVADVHDIVYHSHALAGSERKLRERRLKQALPAEEAVARRDSTTFVNRGETFRLEDIETSRFQAFETLADIHSLFGTLSNNRDLQKFAFLLQWPQLEEAAKNQFYSDYACHELNFFLSRKDPDYFRRVVRPYIANKKEKTFLDHYLLGDDLRPYLDSWAFSRLNLFERILLAKRLGGPELQRVRRHIEDGLAVLPNRSDWLETLFQTALGSQALDTGDSFGLVDRRLESAGGEVFEPEEPVAEEEMEELEEAIVTDEALADLEDADDSSLDAGRKFRRRVAGGLLREESNKAVADRKRMQRLYRAPDPTREWAENNYYQLPQRAQNGDLIAASDFWYDFALNDPGTPFYSKRFPQASKSLCEMLLALSILDLPFEAPQHATSFDDRSMTVTTASPMIVFHQEFRPVEKGTLDPEVLITQNLFRRHDRYRYVDDEPVEKYIQSDFAIHEVYGCQVVVTNLSARRQKLDLLLQIPAGAMALLGGEETTHRHLVLAPYSTERMEYGFYFPKSGSFAHYPAHVSRKSQLVAHGTPRALEVAKQRRELDRESWRYVSQEASDDAVLEYLKTHNLHRLSLERIAFRMRDREFFTRTLEHLRSRHTFNETLWSYAVHHGDARALSEYLDHQSDFVSHCGMALQSPVLRIEPFERGFYQHLDYRPLINARVHAFGRRRQIVNDRLAHQYSRFMSLLTYKRSLDDSDRLEVVAYLLLQDRIEEALRFFGSVDPDRVDTRLQYDYLACYLGFYQEELERAEEIARRYIDHPVDRWRTSFRNVLAHLDEIQGRATQLVGDDVITAQTRLAAKQPSVDFDVESETLSLRWQNLESARVNYYLMDIELLFSRNPFVQSFAGQFSYIRPNLTQELALPSDRQAVQVDLPDSLRNQNVLVEVKGPETERSRPYYSNDLSTQVLENYGQIRVTHRQTEKPLSKVYVKVYAKKRNGSVVFYKDGYTDLRGRFDYASLSGDGLSGVTRFSMLVLSENHGAEVKEARPPKR